MCLSSRKALSACRDCRLEAFPLSSLFPFRHFSPGSPTVETDVARLAQKPAVGCTEGGFIGYLTPWCDVGNGVPKGEEMELMELLRLVRQPLLANAFASLERSRSRTCGMTGSLLFASSAFVVRMAARGTEQLPTAIMDGDVQRSSPGRKGDAGDAFETLNHAAYPLESARS